MTGTPPEALLPRTVFVRSFVVRSMRLPTIRLPGRDMETAPAGTSCRDFPSTSCTDCAEAKSKSSPLVTVGGGRATGSCDSDPPSNLRMQRSTLRAAADPGRSATLDALVREADTHNGE